MKKFTLVTLILCGCLSAQAFTLFRFPNQKLRLEYSKVGEVRAEPAERALERAANNLIETTLSPIKSFSLSEIAELIGPEAELTDDYLLPAYAHAGVALSSSQVNGEASFHLFPISKFAGLVVLQLSENPHISGAAIYFHEDNVGDDGPLHGELLTEALELITAKLPRTEQAQALNP
ncbi:MAG: hypothetical protein AAF357_02950 [Verrucomicrobiota bacterium]